MWFRDSLVPVFATLCPVSSHSSARKAFLMRKALDIVSLIAIAVLAWVTADVFAGPDRLPARVPTHFSLSGQPDGWGSPLLLLFLPVTACLLYLLMTLVAHYPGSFNYPVRVTRANLGRLQTLALQMIGWLKAEVVWLLACIQVSAVHAARTGHSGGISAWLMPTALGVVFGTILGYVVAMRRSA